MKVKKLAKKMKELNSKVCGCRECPFVSDVEECKCTFENICITDHKDILKMEKLFKEG